MAVLDALWFPIMGTYTVAITFFLCVGLNLLFMTILAAFKGPRYTDPGPLESYPRVTVQLPVFNELYVVERLVKATCELDWPRDRLEVQVLDDSTDETQFVVARLVRRWSQQGFNISQIRRPDRVGFKAGALEAGLAEARGEFVAVLDADFEIGRASCRERV